MNYKIEGNINFHTELMKAISEDELDESKDGTCLITNAPLDENHITLECKHKFNYLPLYKEVVIQKSNKYSNDVAVLSVKEIKCPYCRNIQQKLLPFISTIPGVERMFGVNSPEKYSMFNYTCAKIIRSGKRKGEVCGRPSFEKYCKIHVPRVRVILNPGEGCTAVLKSGNRKGEPCNLKKFASSIGDDILCKRHFNIKNKKNKT